MDNSILNQKFVSDLAQGLEHEDMQKVLFDFNEVFKVYEQTIDIINFNEASQGIVTSGSTSSGETYDLKISSTSTISIF